MAIPIKNSAAKTPAIDIAEILREKSLKSKEKVSLLARLILDNTISIEDVINIAGTVPDTDKATLIESMEFASRAKAEIINEPGLQFVIANLKSDAPRIKWESAKVITNSIHLFPELQKKAMSNLLGNTEHSGNVVRWSAAGALSKILQCKTILNKELIPAIGAIAQREQDNAIKKIYQKGLKKITK